jgi:putative ABC transport system substrate-binding protein
MLEDTAMMRRAIRLLVTLALGLLVAPPVADAQPSPKLPRIGLIEAETVTMALEDSSNWAAFRQGLRDFGYVEGQNIALEWRFAEGNLDRLAEAATELVRLQMDLLVTLGTPATRAAKDATTTIPIVIMGVGDPVGSGLVASLARPGSNVTGLASLAPDLVEKQLEILTAVLPTVSRVAVLWNPAHPGHALLLREADVAAQRLGLQLHRVEARSPDAFDRAFAAMTRADAGALLVLGDTMVFQHRGRLAELAATSRLPTMYNIRPFVEAGGLLAYGPSPRDLGRRAAAYVDKILKGAKPADLPVEQPTRFELVLNLKTAQALGLTIPPSVLFQATEVIR